MLARCFCILLVLVGTLVNSAFLSARVDCAPSCEGPAVQSCCGDDSACPCCVQTPKAPVSEQKQLPPVQRDSSAKFVMVLAPIEVTVLSAHPEHVFVATRGVELPRFAGARIQAALCIWRT